MGVYLYPSGTETELKNAYIGEYHEYEYSYDFRNKSTTNLTNDWWLDVSSLTTWSTWITANSWTPVKCNPSWLATAMSNASKLILELHASITSTSICSTWAILCEDVNISKQCWIYFDENTFVVTVNSQKAYETTYSKSTGDKTLIWVFDFVSKTYSGSYTWGNVTFSWTLTDAQIATVRNLGYIYLPIKRYAYTQSISVKVIY